MLPPILLITRSSSFTSAEGASRISVSRIIFRTNSPEEIPAFFALAASSSRSALVSRNSNRLSFVKRITLFIRLVDLKKAHHSHANETSNKQANAKPNHTILLSGVLGCLAPNKRNLYGQVRCLLRQHRRPHFQSCTASRRNDFPDAAILKVILTRVPTGISARP